MSEHLFCLIFLFICSYERVVLALFAVLGLVQAASADITWDLQYMDDPGSGFLDETLGEERRQAVTDVTNYISSVLDHTGTIGEAEFGMESQCGGIDGDQNGGRKAVYDRAGL